MEESLGYCYYFSSYRKSWAAAETQCGSLGAGAHLASIHSWQERYFIQSEGGGGADTRRIAKEEEADTRIIAIE